MARTVVLHFLLIFNKVYCEVYRDRPKILTSNGDLILEPAYDKNIILRPNGPKSAVIVGEDNLTEVKPKTNAGVVQDQTDLNNVLHELHGVQNRLEKLESGTVHIPDKAYFNISRIWRKVNQVRRTTINLQVQLRHITDNKCENQPCQHGGTCLNLANDYFCLCPNNWEGRDCDVDVNECRDFAGTDLGCQNGATCLNRPGTYECQCRSGWFGVHCTRRAKDCSGGDAEMCGHGTCLKIDTGEGFTCICHQGWTTNGTSSACTTDINECDNFLGARCSVNPKVDCINLPGSFRCGECPPGYDGDGYACTDIDECVTLPNGGCSGLVSCHNTIGSRVCGPCPPGYQGDGVTCTWQGLCKIDHGGCHPSARCVENFALGQTAMCVCPDGMDGDGIGTHGCYISVGNDTASCESNTCGPHGECHVLRSGYTCICQQGYSGPHCDTPTDLCANKPCHNGGICRLDASAAAGFRCECSAQYSGPLCQANASTCGGVLENEEGNIAYPLTNSTYEYKTRCVWVVRTVPNKVINVTFTKFDVEGDLDCTKTFLHIHDGNNAASPLIGRYCGKDLPKGGSFVSNQNSLYFWFESDAIVANKGFAFHWTSVPPVCGGELDAGTHGHISSPGSPGKYPPNRDCYWKIQTVFGKKIQLYFFALDIEHHDSCDFDYLAIYDGSREEDPLLGKYCDSTQPAPVTSAGSNLLIHFHSNSHGAGLGFQLVYASVPGVPGCGGYFTEDIGEITPPMFNGTYLRDVLCEYKVKTGQGTKIHIDFQQFDLEKSSRCKSDYLEVYDGPSEESPLVGRFCGTVSPRSYISTANTMFFRFRSTLSVTASGFKIFYKAICQQTLDGDSGVITSPGYPFHALGKRVCDYFIATSPGKAIQLTFQDLSVGHRDDCTHDFVQIRDGLDVNATLIGTFCGSLNRLPSPIISTHNHMHVQFRADLSTTRTVFYANYTTIDTACGGIYRNSSGLIIHPRSASTYRNELPCTWMLLAPPGKTIQVTWNKFLLEDSSACANNYLELLELDENNTNFTLGKYCGSKSPPALTTVNNRLVIKLKSNWAVSNPEFSVSYTFMAPSACGAVFHHSHGSIYSPGWPQRYPANKDCTWTIIAPPGQQIRLNISEFDLESPYFYQSYCGDNNYGDYLALRNGATSYSPLIERYCGQFKTKVVTSLTSNLFLHFHSDVSYGGKGFHLEWKSIVTGCGGTLTSPTGSITSPNYPNSYNENAECFYRIVTSLGSRIRISFKDLSLEQTDSCTNDYVEIIDGKDFGGNNLGRHCRMSSGLNNIETTANYAHIKFRSDDSIGGKGFSLNYTTICNNQVSGRYGVIESPGYPGLYPSSSNCLWNITVSKGNKINVTFTHFSILKLFERVELVPNHYLCQSHYLRWKDGAETEYGDKYCGKEIPDMFTSLTNSLQIEFQTTELYSSSGFRLEWVRQGCGGHVKNGSGSISIDSSTASLDEVDCEWLIETPPGTSVSLKVIDIFLKVTQDCNEDSIEIYNGQDTQSPLLSRLCANRQYNVTSTDNFLLMKFTKRSALKGAYFTSTFNTDVPKCGGRIELLSGFIYSDNYPKNYDNNLNCIWLIMVPPNHRIELNFIDVDLNHSSNNTAECGDHINIYDGNDDTTLEMRDVSTEICPKSNIKNITTKNNELTVQFITDNKGTAKGFKAYFRMACGAFIKANSDGIISNEEFHSTVNKSCTWTIFAPAPDQKVSLTITHISLPSYSNVSSEKGCHASYLRVLDGDDQDAPLIDEYCGQKAPPMIVSKGSAITVVLDSYGNHTNGHFSAHYSSLDEACGGTLTSEEGSIASPNYPRSYPSGANCEWVIATTAVGTRVYITFEQFDLEYSEGCNEDYLEVREDNGGGKILGVFCGADIPTNTTTASKLYIKFHSSADNNGKGFVLHYGLERDNEITMIRDSISITTPLFPHLYHGAAQYSWRIQSKSTENIIITVNNLQIPSFGQSCYNYLSIYDGYDETAPVIDTLCGKLIEPDKIYRASSNMVFIKFAVDDSNTGSVFHLKLKNINKVEDVIEGEKVNCGTNYSQIIPPGNFSTFVSPNYPENYENDLNCEWLYEATPGRHLALQFTKFQLEGTEGCYEDYVDIYSSDTPEKWKLVQHLCEKEPALKGVNSSRYLKLNFKTDHILSNQGFQGKVSSTCGGIISDLSGEVGPIWDDTQNIGYAKNHVMKCDWVINVRPGRLIDFEFRNFNITSKDDNNECTTSVTLRNGNSGEAPLFSRGKYCGFSYETREKLTTSSNSLFISYTSDLTQNSREFQTFIIRYEEQNLECGVTSKLDTVQSWEVINSPNYPNTPVPFTECIWTFTGPPGEILRIDFIDRFDLDKNDNCENEFVEVRDGSSQGAPSLGRFCGNKPGTVKSTNNALHVKYLTQITEPRDGFKANVSIDVCGGTIFADRGEVISPGYPHRINIPYDSVCEWRIKCKSDNILQIEIKDVDLPGLVTECSSNLTIEALSPDKNISPMLKQYCTEDPVDRFVRTYSNEAVIKFRYKKPKELQIDQNRGFRISFTSSLNINRCGEYIRRPEGFLTTPSYPLETGSPVCLWYIELPNSKRSIKLELIDIDPAKHTITIGDNRFYFVYLVIPEANGTIPNSRVFYFPQSTLTVIVWLDPNKTISQHRFKARFSSEEKAMCGGRLIGSSGQISTPDLHIPYWCEWSYNNRAGISDNSETNTILIIASVNSSNSSPSHYPITKLKISSTNTEFVRNLRGTMQGTFRIPSSAMQIIALKDRGVDFSFHVDFKSQPCGGVIDVGGSPVNILKIPYNFNDTLDCAWLVSKNGISRIELKLEGIFQYNCNDEFIKISRDMRQSTPPFANYCKDTITNAPLIVDFETVYIEYHTKSTNSSSLKLMAKEVKEACGGELNKQQNVFSSPNYPKEYEANKECVWYLTAEAGTRVSLHFIDRFVVEDTPNCTKDVVIIFDWSDGVYNEKARLCGRQIPTLIYNSTYNKMKVLLRTDATTNLDGFKAFWTSICSGSYLATDKKQTLFSPGFPNAYPAASACIFAIKAPKGKKLLIQFIEFNLNGIYPECTFSDTLTVMGYFYKRIYCGTQLPPTISQLDNVVISFKSNDDHEGGEQRKGFKFTYQIYECGGEITSPTILSSHYGDGRYDVNLNCTWLIKAPKSKSVILKFLFIDLERQGNCDADFVAVFEGPVIDVNKRLAILCGSINYSIPVRSQDKEVTLQFVSDEYTTANGFKVQVDFKYGAEVGCGGRINLQNSSIQTFRSPLIGNSTVYENYLDCHWSVTSPPDTVIKVEFTSFNITPCLNDNETEANKCDCDYVELKETLNEDVIIGTYCGLMPPPILRSAENHLNIQLTTDGELTSSGFEVRLSAVESVCGKREFELGEKGIRIKSPGHDSGDIPRNLRCTYHLHTRSKFITTKLSIHNIDLEPPTNINGITACREDKLIITRYSEPQASYGKDYILHNNNDMFIETFYRFSDNENESPHVLTYCGTTVPSDLYLYGSLSVTVVTSPDSGSTHKGFELEVSTSVSCRNNYTGTQGKIHITNINYNDYPTDCYNLITAPENHTISAYFIMLNGGYLDSSTYLDVYDGNDTTSQKLARYGARDFVPLFLFSTGRYMLLHNHKNTYTRGIFYEMNYVTTDQGRGCGGSLNVMLGRVTSPMYPDVYRRDARCEWNLETPVGTKLKLHFKTFDLGRACDQNYLELVNRQGAVLSAYCSEQPADYTSEDNYIKIVFHTSVNNGGPGWIVDFVGIK